MVSTVWVNADHGRDFHPQADHITKLLNFTKDKNHDFSAFRYSFHLMLEQIKNQTEEAHLRYVNIWGLSCFIWVISIICDKIT